ncbi:hypothetical protein [Nonomuraea soli]|uniref:Uncharacterized protein n=1 Tax=Nonomuraea soli TaxID=1032476 RepID=A0A7W0HN95_9ACTN|nr:hypothetical protein [Nonomuraea soli]MBA2889554.1 hypothetical protein [Nonomuraea soli]
MKRVTVERRPAPVGRVVLERAADPHGHDPLSVARVKAAQLRQALATVAVVLGVLVGLPLLVAALDGPTGWAVLTLAAQPLWMAIAVWQLRRAERLER